MNTDFIINALKYFAKFPAKSAVLSNFTRTTEKITGYTTLKSYIQALPETGLFPEIKTFIFTIDSKKLENYVRNAKSYFMLIEFGQIVGAEPDTMKSVAVDWYFAITLAHPADPQNTDAIEEAMLSNNCLDLCLKILQQMRTDDVDVCHRWQNLESDVILSPVEPSMLLNNVGWTFTFRKNLDNIF